MPGVRSFAGAASFHWALSRAVTESVGCHRVRADGFDCLCQRPPPMVGARQAHQSRSPFHRVHCKRHLVCDFVQSRHHTCNGKGGLTRVPGVDSSDQLGVGDTERLLSGHYGSLFDFPDRVNRLTAPGLRASRIPARPDSLAILHQCVPQATAAGVPQPSSKIDRDKRPRFGTFRSNWKCCQAAAAHLDTFFTM